jgi:DNA-directed RNA polymerase subunit RPC12/RpoP
MQPQTQPTKPTAYICSPCGQRFEGDNCVQQYYDHTCPATNYKPTDPRHLGPEFAAISAAAQQRGAQYKIDTSQQPPEQGQSQVTQ